MMKNKTKASPNNNHTHYERVKIDCTCNRNITIEELTECYPGQKISILERFLPHINSTFNKYEINTCMRRMQFLAQIGHESGCLSYTAEILPKGVLESNIYDGYKGRGLIQITWKANYDKYGKYIGKNLLENNKIQLEAEDLATDSAGWFWTNGSTLNINNLADPNDFIAITIIINGGLNGFEHRKSLLKNCYDALNLGACKSLAALREHMPEEAKKALSVDKYHLDDSIAFNNPRSAFAWGYWHDPNSKRSGTKKNKEESALGYKRFLDLIEKKPFKKKAFGLTSAQMEKIARTATQKKD
jgi:putative chitinase